jgi:hypothetical protein
MKTEIKNTEKSGIIVAFHTGRGGCYNNPGHTSFIGEKKISEFTDDLFIRYENESEILKRFNNEKVFNAFREAINDKDFETLEKFGIKENDLGKEEYYRGECGTSVGLMVDNNGTGSINIDYQYDTTTACFIEDCSENDIIMIVESADYKSIELESWIEANWPELVVKLLK